MNPLVENDLNIDDLENILLNADEMKAYLKKLKESCQAYDEKIECTILESISKSSECAKRVEKSSESILQLSNQAKELKSHLESINLEQKIIEKRTIRMIQETEKVKADILSFKEEKERLSLEIIDLEQVHEKKHEYLQKQWDALKKACSVYKNVLDIHIDSKIIDDVEQVTITFFRNENPTDKKFFVVLTCEDDCWKVKKIEPELSAENKYQLNHIVQFSEQSKVVDVTLLLCELRILFLKNYLSS